MATLALASKSCQPSVEASVFEAQVGELELPDGKKPFSIWLSRLKDVRARSLVRARIARIRTGNFGDCESVGEGVFELRIHHGPGYRVYLSRPRNQSVVLLLGGDKSRQHGDILKARRLWAVYKESDEQ